MKKTLFLIVVISFFAFSCKKKNENTELQHHIKGVVLDTRAIAYPEIANVNLTLEEKKLEGGVFNGSFVELATTNSDDFGRYDYTFEKRNTIEYQLSATKENYFPYKTTLDPELIKPGITYVKNVQMIPQAWIETTIINENPLDESDKITFQFLNASFNCACCTNEQSTYIGTSVNETSQCTVYGNKWIKYMMTIDRSDSPAITSIDSVYCHSFDTTHVAINY